MVCGLYTKQKKVNDIHRWRENQVILTLEFIIDSEENPNKK